MHTHSLALLINAHTPFFSLSLLSTFIRFRFRFLSFAGRCYLLRGVTFQHLPQLGLHVLRKDFTMFKSVLVFASLFALAIAAPIPDGGSAYTGAGGSANGGSVTKSQKWVEQ